MKIPRNVHGKDLVKAFNRLGYNVIYQSGSHIKMKKLNHVIIIPNNSPVKVDTLSTILKGVSENLGILLDELIDML